MKTVQIPAPQLDLASVRRNGLGIPWRHMEYEVQLPPVIPENLEDLPPLGEPEVCTVEIRPTNVIDSTRRLWMSEECPHGFVYFFLENRR